MFSPSAPLAPPPRTGNDPVDRWLVKLYEKVPNLAGIVIETAATRTVGLTDNYIVCNRAGTVTLTLPDPKTAGPRVISVRTWTANTVVSASSNVVGATGGAAGTAILAATAGRWADLVSDGTAWNIVRNN